MTVYSYTVLATANIYIVAQQVTELMMTVVNVCVNVREQTVYTVCTVQNVW